MDNILCVGLGAQSWEGNRIRFILARKHGREIWEITLDHSAGIGEARRAWPIKAPEETPEAGPSLADESVLLDVQTHDPVGELLPEEAA